MNDFSRYFTIVLGKPLKWIRLVSKWKPQNKEWFDLDYYYFEIFLFQWLKNVSNNLVEFLLIRKFTRIFINSFEIWIRDHWYDHLWQVLISLRLVPLGTTPNICMNPPSNITITPPIGRWLFLISQCTVESFHHRFYLFILLFIYLHYNRQSPEHI